MSINQELDKYLGKYKGYELGILKAEHLKDFVLEVWFEENRDVSIYELDLYPFLSEPEAGVLADLLDDKERFSLVDGRYTLTWYDPETGEHNENAIDIAPEAIRWLCVNYGKIIKKPKNSE